MSNSITDSLSADFRSETRTVWIVSSCAQCVFTQYMASSDFKRFGQFLIGSLSPYDFGVIYCGMLYYYAII